MKSNEDIVNRFMKEELPDNHDELISINKQLYNEREKLNDAINKVSDDFIRNYKNILKQDRNEYNASRQNSMDTNNLINRYNNLTMLIEAVEKKMVNL